MAHHDTTREHWLQSAISSLRPTIVETGGLTLPPTIHVSVKDWMRSQTYEDGSRALRWVEMQYGDDEYITAIADDGDRELRENGFRD